MVPHRLAQPRPLIFMLGTREMISADSVFTTLSLAFRNAGYFTHTLIQPDDAIVLNTAVTEYQRAIHLKAATADGAVLLGYGDGAEAIAKSFWDFYSVTPPRGVVLLAANIAPIQLNNITCPYLILNGENDPSFQFEPYERITSAVHHHQMRYGDVTTQFRFMGTSGDLTRDGKLDEEVLLQIVDWVKLATTQGFRPQETSTGSAA